MLSRKVELTNLYLKLARKISHNIPKLQFSSWRSTYINFGRHYRYFHSGQYLQKQRFTNHDWNDDKFFQSDYYIKPFAFVPVCIILSLVGIREVYCKEKNQDINLSDKNVDSENTFENNVEQDTNNKKENTSKDNINSKTSKEKDIDSSKSQILKDKNDSHQDQLELQPLPNFKSFTSRESLTLKGAIDISRNFLRKKLHETGAPGIAVSVSVNGRIVWSEGIGYADLENGVHMSPSTVMRIASISKSLTMVAVGQLVEEGKLDLDAPIQNYVPSFPKKIVDGKEVTITTRHLLSHSSGIRHYKLKDENSLKKRDSNKDNSLTSSSTESKNEHHSSAAKTPEEKLKRLKEIVAQKSFKTNNKKPKDNEFDLEEYYIKEKFENVKEALKLFQDDDLLFEPGTDYCYSTHGFTLVSAIVEAVAEKPFEKVMVDLFGKLDMPNTFLDKSEPIIYNRASYYIRDSFGRLKNAPYVDNSYIWAGGGFLSTVRDITNFGNLMLYSYQSTKDAAGPRGFLKASTVKEIWTPVMKKKSSRDDAYGLGWGIMEGDAHPKAYAYNQRFCVSHSGGAIGASSIVLVMPTYDPHKAGPSNDMTIPLPQGIVVSIITNMQNVGLHETASNVARTFDRVPYNPKVIGNISQFFDSKVYGLETS